MSSPQNVERALSDGEVEMKSGLSVDPDELTLHRKLSAPTPTHKKTRSTTLKGLLHSDSMTGLSKSPSTNKLNEMIGFQSSYRLTELEEERIQRSIEDKLVTRLDRQASQHSHMFELSDAFTHMRSGLQVVVDDDFSRCFKESEHQPWNWNAYLFPMWLMGVVLRYLVLLPIRIALLMSGFVLCLVSFAVVTAVVGNIKTREKLQREIIKLLCGSFVLSWTGVIKTHGVIPRRAPGQIYVSNHSSMIDMIVLSQSHSYSVVGQQHTGWVGHIQNKLLSCLDCIWFNRATSKDKKEASRKIKEVIGRESGNRLLIFPEGTCVNNEYMVQFKKGPFEMADTICPIAIKYNKTFADGYWNSRAKSFAWHLIDLMTSWAVVCDVWYLEPQTIQPGETAIQFAQRVQKMIGKTAGLIPVEWDGYMKYFRPSVRFVQKQQALFASQIRRKMVPAPIEEASSEDQEELYENATGPGLRNRS